MNIADILRDAARSAPKKTALMHGHHVVEGFVTYAELNEAADHVAAGLVRAGVGPGDRVAIVLPNVPRFASSYFGILRAGAIVVPLNTMLTEHEMAGILADSGARFVICAPALHDTVRAAAAEAGSVDRIVTTDQWREFAGPGEVPPVEPADDDVAVLAYTSGTTGEPKGAMLSHGNLMANLQQQMAIPEAHVSGDDVLMLTLPLFHIFGLNVTLGLTVMNAATGIMIERFEPVAALRLIQEHKVTVLFGAPPMYRAWVDTPGSDQYDLSSVRLAVSGAAPLPETVLNGFKQLFGVSIYEGYGLTETAPTLTSNRMTSEPRGELRGQTAAER